MTIITKFGRVLALAATVSLALAPAASFANTVVGTFVANQTVASAAAGVNTQTLATSSSVANVAEVKANRVLNVAAAPAASESITIGSCVVSFATTTAGVGAQDINCGDNAATIRTATTSSDIAKTAVQIAADLASLTGTIGSGHGTLTSAIGTTTSKVSFTTSTTEAAATPIAFTDATSGDIVSYISTAGVIPVAQVWIVTPASVEIGDVFTATINGTVVSYTATAATVANVTAGLTTAINASGVAPVVTAADGTTQLTVTSDVAGTSFTLTSTAVNRAAVAQVVTFTPVNPDINNVFTLSINGVDYVYDTANGTGIQSIVEGLRTQLVASTVVSCSEDDTKVTCAAISAPTTFTYSASVTGGTSSGGSSHHSGSGGGHSSSSNSSTSTTTSTPATGGTVTTTIGTVSVGVGASVSAFADLTVGATNAQVTTLQTWLIAKGFSIPAGATGYFGAQTKAALAAFQKASGIAPAVGYFGPLTRAYIAAH